MNVGALVVDLPNLDTGMRHRVALHVGHLAVQVGHRADRRSDSIVDAEEVIVGIEGKLVGIKRPFGHRRSGGQGFGKGTGSGEEGSGPEGGATDEFTTVRIGVGRKIHGGQVVELCSLIRAITG